MILEERPKLDLITMLMHQLSLFTHPVISFYHLLASPIVMYRLLHFQLDFLFFGFNLCASLFKRVHVQVVTTCLNFYAHFLRPINRHINHVVENFLVLPLMHDGYFFGPNSKHLLIAVLRIWPLLTVYKDIDHTCRVKLLLGVVQVQISETDFAGCRLPFYEQFDMNYGVICDKIQIIILIHFNIQIAVLVLSDAVQTFNTLVDFATDTDQFEVKVMFLLSLVGRFQLLLREVV